MTESGNVGIGTTSPVAPLQIDGGTDLPDGGGYVVIGDENGLHISLDNNEIMCRDSNSTEPLIINDGGRVVLGSGARTTAGDLGIPNA